MPSLGYARDTAKDEREDQHQSDRLEQRPAHAEHRLLVANPDPVGGERPEQIDVPRQRPQIGCKPLPMAWTTDRHRSIDLEPVQIAQRHCQLICKADALPVRCEAGQNLSGSSGSRMESNR